MRDDKGEHQPAINAIIIEYSFWQGWSIGGSEPNHSVQANHAGNFGVAWIGAPHVRAHRRLVSERIIFVKEKVIVALLVCAEFGIVMEGAEGQRSATAPPSHHLGGKELFLLRTSRILLQTPAKRRHALMQLSKDYVGTVTSQSLRIRN